jgi:dienelactone hydrolase
MKENDPLEDFARREITLDAVTKLVYVSGAGPAVIVMTEMPGISPHVARFARWVREAGFTVYMPSLFGRDGAVPGAEEGAAVIQRACVSAEFRALSSNQSSPVTRWLRSLARFAHGECGGPGVGAIGMCFTGNFALTMMLEPSMLGPVLNIRACAWSIQTIAWKWVVMLMSLSSLMAGWDIMLRGPKRGLDADQFAEQ